MSDPISATIQMLQIGFTAISAGAAIGRYWETRQANRTTYEKTPSEYRRQSIPDIFLVLATIGQRLLHLRAINHGALPEARDAAREAFGVASQDCDFGAEYDQSGEVMQYAIACAMVFCSECWPMHMWQGFGCGLMNDMSWAELTSCNVNCVEMDRAIAAFKSKPHEWHLLTKSPSRIGLSEPYLGTFPKAVSKEIMPTLKDIVREYEKRGFPQPLPPHDELKITSWWFPMTTWGSGILASLYLRMGHDYELSCKCQLDPGKLFFAWTAGRHAELRQGEAILLPQPHVQALAQWLEGLNGMNFKVLLDTEVDDSRLKYKSSTKKHLKRITGNERGVCGLPFVMVGLPPSTEPPVPQMQRISIIASPNKESAPSLTSDHGDGLPPEYAPNLPPPVTPGGLPSAIRRRPVPQPPAAVRRVVSATHTFTPMTEGELPFVAGDRIEITDDSSLDGWWKARLNGREGVIPRTFVQ